MNLKYIIGSALALPLLPILYFQAKRLNTEIPRLPEAKGTSGQEIIAGKKSKRILIIGESTMAGVGVNTNDEGFAGALSRELSAQLDISVDWLVCAKSGYTCKQVTRKVLPKITTQNVDLIVVGLGANDAFELKTPSGWIKDIQALITQLQMQFTGTPIVFNNMPPIKEFPAFTSTIKITIGNLVEIFGEELKRYTDTLDSVFYNSAVINFESWITKFDVDIEGKEFFSDGVHPSKFTYEIWAKEMAMFIEDNVKL